MRGLLFGFIVILLLLCRAQSSVHYHDFVVKEKNFTRLCSTKSMLVVNESFPGPVIRVQKGDTVYVNVHNQGVYGITIHWHGVHQQRNSWSDGPEYVTQCPIPAGTNFTYEVIFSDEEGTLWWHAHSDWTRSSVHGAILIYPSNQTAFPFPAPDGEEVLVLASWYTGDVNKEVKEELDDGSDTPTSNAYTINGQPGDFCLCSKESTHRWQVEYGKTYLLRLVNAVMNVEMFFAIAEHKLTVVGMDGSYIKPIVTDYVMLGPGNAMDILVTANQSVGQYYMATRQFDSVKPDVLDYDHVNATAIMEYKGSNFNSSDLEEPIFPSTLPSYEDFNSAINFTRRLRSLADEDHPVDVPKNISTRMYITVAQNMVEFDNGTSTRYGLSSSLNNVSWVNQRTDVLLAYYRNLSGYFTKDFPDYPPSLIDFVADDLPSEIAATLQGTKVKVLDYNEQVEIVFQDTNIMNASEDHPMHMHGYSFYVVGSGSGIFNNVTDPEGFNLIDPPKLNTVSLPKKGWAAIRFKATNPGVWLWHCHYERHYSWGMNTVFIVKNGGTSETSIRKPPPYLPPCQASSSSIKIKQDDPVDGKISILDLI